MKFVHWCQKGIMLLPSAALLPDNYQKDPLDDSNALLAFDTEEYKRSATSHNHSNDRLDILENSKPWLVAKASWRKKVRGISHLF
jgi:hypothetical protein